jgi:chitodextrinase
MWFLKLIFQDAFKPKAHNRRYYIKWAICAAVIAVLVLVGATTCNRCAQGGSKPVDRTQPDVSHLSVIFSNGEATLYWIDPDDYVFDHIEITLEPGGEPVNVARNVGQFVIPGLDEGTEYTFTVRAVDKWGNKSSLTDGGAGMGFMQKGKAGIIGIPAAEQVTLSWTNLADSEYSHIEIQYEPNGSTLSRVPHGVESKTLSGLENGIEYTFTITAVDTRGNRKLLDETGIYIPRHATAPESVFGSSSAGQATLVWQIPSHFRPDHFEVVFSPEGETPVTVAKDAESWTVSGLSDVIDYEFTVYAANSAGHRRPLMDVSILTPLIPLFDGRDAEQMVIKGIPVAGQVILEWTAPVMEDLDHIAIIYEPGRAARPVTVSGERERATLVGLSDSTEYTFLAYGVDAQGNNRVITGLQLATPELSQIIARPVEGRVRLVWTDPIDPSLDYLEISYRPDGETPVRVAKGVETYTFTGLSDRNEYEFTITAVNTAGNIYTIATASAIVTQLAILTGTPINRQLSLSWIDPADVRFDHIEIIHSPGGEKPQIVARGMESHTFTGLANNTEYTFTIYALDSMSNRHPVRSAQFYDPRTAFTMQELLPYAETEELRSLTWKSANNTFGESTVNSIAFGVTANGIYRWSAGGSEGKLAYSDDNGVNWVPLTDSPFGSFSVNSIGYGNGRWVAGARGGRIAWSTNAIVWNMVRIPSASNNLNINVVAFGNGRWMAGGSDGSIHVSEDNGVTWRSVATNAFGQSAINTMVFHGGRWMAGGAAGKIAWSDDNGRTWTAVGDSTFGSSAVSVIVYDRERWLAAGYAQRIAYSADGTTWKTLPRPFYTICLGYNGIRWVAGGQGGRMAWSVDGGENWTNDEQSQGFFGENWVQAIAYGRAPHSRGRWLCGGQNGRILYADEQ